MEYVCTSMLYILDDPIILSFKHRYELNGKWYRVNRVNLPDN